MANTETQRDEPVSTAYSLGASLPLLVTVLGGSSFLFFTAWYGTLQAVPALLARRLLSPANVPIVIGTVAWAMLAARLAAVQGIWRWGLRRLILLSFVASIAGTSVLLAATGLVPLVVGRLFQGFGYVSFTSATSDMILASVSPARRLDAVARFGATANASMLITPFLFTWILNKADAVWAVSLCGLLLVASALLAEAACRLSCTPAQIRPAPYTRGSEKPANRVRDAAIFCFGGAFGTFLYFVPRLSGVAGPAAAGIVFTSYAVGIIITRVAITRHANAPPWLLGSFALMSFGLMGLVLLSGVAALIGSALTIGASAGVIHPTLLSLSCEGGNHPGRSASAEFYLAQDIGILFGAFLLPMSLGSLGVPALFIGASVTALCGAIAAAFCAPMATCTNI